MTLIGWIQILLYCAIIVALVKPLGGYMTRVFNGERTFLSPALLPRRGARSTASAASTRSASSIGSPTRSPCCCSTSAAFSSSMR